MSSNKAINEQKCAIKLRPSAHLTHVIPIRINLIADRLSNEQSSNFFCKSVKQERKNKKNIDKA